MKKGAAEEEENKNKSNSEKVINTFTMEFSKYQPFLEEIVKIKYLIYLLIQRKQKI